MPKKLGSLGHCEFPLNSEPLRSYRRGILIFILLLILRCILRTIALRSVL